MLKKVKSGFSLVELSLVLIIVALIISAVVSGKSLVQNSKLTLLHSEMQTLKIALGNYISDNQLSSFLAGTDISLYNLMNEGYLEDKTVFQKDGTTVSTASDPTDIFKSNYSGGIWRYVGTKDDVIVKFGKLKKTAGSGKIDGKMEQLLATGPAAVFKNKYEKTNSIKIENVNESTQGSGSNVVTIDAGLQITFLDGAQN